MTPVTAPDSATDTDTETGSQQLTFYRLQGCPYCERVTRLLERYDLAYRSRFVEPLHSQRNVVKRVAGVRTVPVIVDQTTGVTMAESGNIVTYLERMYGEESAAESHLAGVETTGDHSEGESEVEVGTETGTGGTN